MRATEKAARADLRALPAELAGSALARAVIGVARALDGDPAPTARVLLVRELRLALADLRAQAAGDVTDDVSKFLAGLSAPAFDAGH